MLFGTEKNRLRLLPLALSIALAGCASQQALKEGQALINAGRYEEGLARLNDAALQSPNEPEYRSAVVLEQERIIATLLARADRMRSLGDYESAMEAYQRVLRLSPRN